MKKTRNCVCCLCGRASTRRRPEIDNMLLCDECVETMPRPKMYRCRVCGRKTTNRLICPRCQYDRYVIHEREGVQRTHMPHAFDDNVRHGTGGVTGLS